MARKKTIETRGKILDAAAQVFKVQGFQAAKIADICALANTNIASVNYHFGSKEKLYQETWTHTFTQSILKHPLNGGVGPDAPPEERLRGHITGLVQRILDPETTDILIAQFELMNPSGILDDVMQLALDPMREHLLSIIAALLGDAASPEQISHCELCIASMCIHPMVMQRFAYRNMSTNPPIMIHDVDALVETIILFATSGIAAARTLAGTARQ